MAKSRGTEVSTKTRFEVFKRDGFKCQYCGRTAPDVILHCDHINPKANDGGNEIINLITSCVDCNLGKGPRLLDDHTAIEKQREQLAELQERREQLEMMLQWREGLMGIEDDSLNSAKSKFEALAKATITEAGIKKLKGWIKKYGLVAVLDAIDASTSQYLEPQGEVHTSQSVGKAFDFIGRIAAVEEAKIAKPYLRDLFYIRGILRKRLRWLDERRCLALLEKAHLAGATIDSLRNHAAAATGWNRYETELEEFIDTHGVDHSDTPTTG
ncbi:MAG: HNH endonuclease [Actinomycetota bacterium]